MPQVYGTPAQYSVLHNSHTIDAAGERVAFRMIIGRSGTITKIGFRTGAVTTAQTLKVELQTISLTTGEPTGTLYGGSAKGTQAAPAANTYYEVTLGTSATAVAGDYVAIVIEFDSTVGNLEIDVVRTGSVVDNVGHPNTMIRVGGSWSIATEDWPICHFVYSGTPDIYDSNMCFPIKDCFEHSGGGAIGAQMGLKFTMPFAARLSGAYLAWRPRGNNKMVLMKADNTVLDTVDNLDADVWGSTTSHRWTFIPLSAPVILEKGATYRYVTENKTTTGQFLYGLQFLNNNILGAWTAKDAYYSHRAAGGATAWTDWNDYAPYLQLMFDQIGSGGKPTLINKKP
jgi:hypothetical protein